MSGGARRRLADRLAAQSVPEEPEHLTDPFSRGIASALQRRGIVTVPGQKTAAEIAHDRHRQRVRDVVEALTPRPPAPEPEPEPVRESLPAQLRRLIGSNPADLALNGQQLIDHATARLHDPGANSAASGQQAEPQ